MKTKLLFVLLFACMMIVPDSLMAQKKDIAIQLYSVRDRIGSFGNNAPSDYSAILKELAQMGYTAVEAASYRDGTFYGRSPQEFKKDIEATGMKVLSSHCSKGLSKEELASGDLTESLKWWDIAIQAHKEAGMKYVVTPSMPVPETLKDLQTYCEYYNEIGKRCKANGLKYGYHNHDFEFVKIEDKVMYDYMIENTNPEYVFFEMDVYWVMMGKASPVDYFNKYPGRFTVLHIKDRREIGQSGMVGFDAIFNNAETAGVKDIVVEVERYTNGVEKGIKESLDYLLKAPFVKASYSK